MIVCDVKRGWHPVGMRSYLVGKQSNLLPYAKNKVSLGEVFAQALELFAAFIRCIEASEFGFRERNRQVIEQHQAMSLRVILISPTNL